MHSWNLLFLFASGLLAGVVNSVAGGGALVIYPLLLSMGVLPINANATTTLTVGPGAASSAYGYRKNIAKLKQYYFLLLIPCLIGGIIGASILRRTSNHQFEIIAPWFMLFAVILTAFQPKIHEHLYQKRTTKRPKWLKRLPFLLIAIGLFFLSIYGGYFGAGYGIVALAFLGLSELSDIRQMNGLKNLTAICVNLAASVYFIVYHLVDWRVMPFLLTGSILGGLVGSSYASRLSPKLVRNVVVAIGSIATAVLFVRLLR